MSRRSSGRREPREPREPRERQERQGRQERQAKVASLRARQEAQRRRRRTLVGGGAAAVVLAVVVTLGVVIQAGRTSGDGSDAAPAGFTQTGGYRLGERGAAVEVALYEDFLCPACATFEEQVGATLAQLVEGGEVQLTYYPIAFLDRASTDRYSTRSLNAAGCVVDDNPEAFPAFHGAVFDEQPAEGGPGLPDERLVALAAAAGADRAAVAACVEQLDFEAWTVQVTDSASRAGVNQTPTVLVDGRPLGDRSPAGLRAAVRAAAESS